MTNSGSDCSATPKNIKPLTPFSTYGMLLCLVNALSEQYYFSFPPFFGGGLPKLKMLIFNVLIFVFKNFFGAMLTLQSDVCFHILSEFIKTKLTMTLVSLSSCLVVTYINIISLCLTLHIFLSFDLVDDHEEEFS